jgi:hypothetical protein
MIFRNWVLQNFPFLEDDFDALTDYELFCKMVEYMKKSLDKIKEYQEEINNFSAKIDEFQNYFDNLDVTEEVNAKLDEMVEDGTMEELIAQYLQLQTTYTYNSVAEMKLAENLVNGAFTRTSGYYSYNDGGGAYYKIRNMLNTDVLDDASIIALHDSSLVAELIKPNIIKPEIFGAVGDGEEDDTSAFEKMFNYVLSYQTPDEIGYTYVRSPSMILTKKYYIDNIEIPDDLECFTLDGEHEGYITHGGFIFNNTNGWQTTIENLTFNECDEPLVFEYRNKEYGKIIIKNCIFTNCTTVCLNIARRSHQVFIEKNKFAANDKTAIIEDVDMFYFKENWVENTTDWENNHYDIEQISTNEGQMFITNNLFIPGNPNQTEENLYWLKITKNANIEGNRFSDENNNIYSAYIDYVDFDTYTADKILYPIINIINNPYIGGKASFVLNKFCGVLNIKNNSFVSTKTMVRVVNDTIFNNLDYDKLTISISDNGGRQLNYKNYLGNASGILEKTLPICLNKFIKTKNLFLKNKNLNIETTLTDSHTIKIKLNDHSNKTLSFAGLIPVQLNYNPGGSPDYSNTLLLMVNLMVYYTNAIVIAGVTKCLSDNPDNCTFTTKINGEASIPYSSFPTDDIEITIDIQGPYAASNILKATCLPMEFEPTDFLMNN